MFMIQHFTITKSDGKHLIKDLNLQIKENEKLAIIGEEGTGKSTLLKAMCGIDTDYVDIKGSVACDGKIVYLPQRFPIEWMDTTILDYLLKDDINQEIEPEQYNQLKTIEQCWIQMKGDISFLYGDQKIKQLSGGEKVKLQLLKLMLQPHDYVLLDEPSNDLDIHTLEWLEEWIKELDCPCVFISHDQKLLNTCATDTLHIEQVNRQSKAKYTLFKGSYKEYIKQRNDTYKKDVQIAHNEKKKYQKQMQRMNDIANAVTYAHNTVSRQQPHVAANLKAKLHTVNTQVRRIEEKGYSKVDIPQDVISLYFEDDVKLHGNKEILNYTLSELKVEDRILCKDILLQVQGNDKIALLGNNGCGKTTLLKRIYTQLKDRKDIKIGYMPQNYMEDLDEHKKIMDLLCTNYDKEEIIRAGNLLGSLNFTGEEMEHCLKDVSDGQKAKAYLASFVMKECNVLLLDEPTRNLSPLSQPVVYKLLKDFKGCIICVSHDRSLLEEVFETGYQIENKQWRKIYIKKE